MTDPTDESGLTPYGIQEGIDEYLRARERDVSASTLKAHKYRLSHLVRWASGRDDITDTSDLGVREINHDYKLWREDDGDLSQTSIHTQMSTVRVWIKWLGSVGAAPRDLHEYIDVPTLDPDEDVRNVVLDDGVGEEILDYLSTFHYASTDHVVWVLLFGTGMRIGGVHSLDVDDAMLNDGVLRLRHRPDQGTTLKNGDRGERMINIAADIVDVLEAYLSTTRYDQRDDHGRNPLVTSEHGRLTKSSIRRRVYRWTQPCQRGHDCPHGTTKESCATAGYTSTPSGCPSIVSPHAIRKRVVARYRNQGIPDHAIRDRCNVNEETIEKHYDIVDEEEKTERREEYFT